MNRKLVLALGAVVAAALAVWWWRGRSAPEGDGGAAKPPVTAAAPRPAPSAGREARTGELDVSPRVLIDDDPKGTLRLEGQVVDADDHPVAGATVALGSNPPRTVVSEADGGFAFDGLVGRPYSLIARSETGIAGPVTTRLTDKSDPVVLKLRPAAKLTVTVTGGGKPIDGATIELRGIDEQRETTRAGKAVFAAVVPGSYQVVAWSAGMARAFQWVQVGAGDADVKLALIAGAAVAGRVVDERGAGVGGARVRFSGASDWSQQANDRLDAVESAADGTFEFPAIGAGTFRFLASHPDKAPGTSALITLDGKLRRDGVTITVTAGAVVRGRVLDGAKHGVAASRVRIGSAAGGRMFALEAPRQVYADASGRFEIRGLPRRALLSIALADTGASQAVPVDTTAGDVNDVMLELDVTGSIAGVVVDPQGQPMEGVQVSAGPSFRDNRTPVDFSQWRLRGFPQELTDATGRFALTGLAPGTYTVSAMPAASASRGRRGAGEGTTARTGDTNLRLVLAPEGGVKGKVAFADGSAPAMFSISIGMTAQSFGGDGAFALDALPPQKYELSVRGPSFQTRVLDVVIESGKTADAGTITVVKGRSVGGHVVADGQPVAGATVYAGRQIFGNGTSSSAGFGPMAQGAKHETTDDQGAFAFAGFGESDVTIVAEHEAIGRSRALRLPAVMPGQTELTLVLEKFGSLTGVLRQGGKPAEGVLVTCQSTSTPGALYAVSSGADGGYRFDRLAPDVYKVSATVGMPMTGMRFYSKQVEVPPGKQVTIDLAVEPGSVTLEVTAVPRAGKLGMTIALLATGTLGAKTWSELQLKSAASGPGASQTVFSMSGGPLRFNEVAPGSHSVCVVPLPAEIQGMASMGYLERHGDTLPTYCKSVGVAAAPASQALAIPVELPPLIDDKPPGGGSGSQGSGSQGSGSGG